MMDLSKEQKAAREILCLPLDNLDNISDVKSLVKELSPYVGIFKIGKESFTRFGPDVLRVVKSFGAKVFLDLKFHDIPNTVKGACKAASELGADIINVHSLGGLDMMKAAKEGVNESNVKVKPKLIAVTILTSIDEKILNDELNIKVGLEKQVLSLALLAKNAGLDGIVCSASDLGFIKKKLPSDFMFVTPGIKGPNTSAGNDQKRVASPYNAVKDGSSVLVIGRAITGAKDRVEAAIDVLNDIVKAL